MVKQSKVEIKSIDNHIIPGVLHVSSDILSAPQNKKSVLLIHGIFSDKNERGRFIRLSDLLAMNGYEALRIDYRGHGEHPVKDEKATISGMILDISSALKYLNDKRTIKICVVASSFGASVFLLYLQTRNIINIDRIVLLNPVVDYNATFFNSTLSWGRNLFNSNVMKELNETGFATLEDGYKMNPQSVIELSIFKPYLSFRALEIPTLVMHGDCDSKVPHDVSRDRSSLSTAVKFKTITGAEHAFKTDEHETETFKLTNDWICQDNRI